MNSLEGYIDNISATAMQSVATSTPFAELSASLEISVDTVAIQAKEIAQLHRQLTALKNKSGGERNEGGATNAEHTPFVCPHCTVVGRSAPHKKDTCFFDPKKMTDRKDWAQKLMDDKGVACKDDK